MLGDARLADRERLHELADRPLALAQEVEDAAARRLGQDLECARHAAYIAAQLYVCQAMRTQLRGCLRQVRGRRAQLGSIRPMWRRPAQRRMSSCSTTASRTPCHMPSATMSSDTGTVPTRVTSSRFIGRSRELAELEAALADASAGRPSLAFIAGESGVGKTRLLKELERGALAAEARVVSGDCVSLGDDELPYAPIVAALRSLTRDGDPVLDELGPATRAGLASLLPELAPSDGARRSWTATQPAQSRVFEALLTLLDLLGRERARGAGDRGPPLGRRLDARLPRLPGAQPARRARAARRRPTAPTSCTAATRCARCSPSSSAGRARAASSSRRSPAPSSPSSSRTSSAPPPTTPCSRACTRAARATRSSPRSCWPPASTAAASCRRRCATRSWSASRRSRRTPRTSCACSPSRRRLDHALLAEASGLDAATLREALREAVAGHVIVADSDGRYAFRHALLREVVHDDLLPGEHAELHLALARAFEHRMRRAGAAAPGSPPASRTTTWPPATSRPRFAAAVRAADAAEEIHAHGEAARLFERALRAVAARARPRGARRAPTTRRCSREAADAHDDDGRARRGALRGGAAPSRRRGRPPPRRRAARAPGLRALGTGRRRARPGDARARARAAPRGRRQRRARGCSPSARSSPCSPAATAARSRPPARRSRSPRRPASPARARARSTRWAHR